jgi:alpha-tubulin suppressor-like RCC1 family protein
LLCWGENAAGELGGSDAGGTSPFAIEMPTAPALGATGASLTGSPFTLAICGASTAAAPFCIGSNHEQQLATPIFAGSVNVAINASLSDAGATPPTTSFAVGDYTTCAIDHAGALYCWGQNEGDVFNGALGKFSITGIPLKIPGLPTSVAQGALSQTFGCVLDSAGGITCWGSNQHANLGTGETDGGSAPMPPSAVVGFDGTGTLPPAQNVQVGNNACAILAGSCGAGSVVCWGRSIGGNLGNDSGAQDSPIPLRVLAPNPDGGF